MPDVSYSIAVRHLKDPEDTTSFTASGSITQTGAESSKQIVSAGTSWTAVKSWLFTSECAIAIQNLSATNYVQVAIANDDSNIFARILPLGAPLILPLLDSAVYYIKANSAACDVAIFAVEA
jgi:hypothetical protein